MMMNCFEDLRIEAKQSAVHVGVGDNLRALHDYTAEKIVKATFKGERKDPKTGRPLPIDPWWGIGMGIIASAQGRDTSWLPGPYRMLVDLCQDEIDAVPSMKTAQDALDLARRVIEKMKEAGEESESSEEGDMGGEGEERKDKKDKKGSSERKSKSGEKEDEDSGPSHADEEEGGNDGEGEEAEGNDGEETEGDADKEGGKSGKPSEEKLDEEAKEAARGLMSKDATGDDITDEVREDIKTRAEYDINKNRRHIPHPALAGKDRVYRADPGDEIKYHTYMDEVRPQVSALRSKILTVLQSRKARRHDGDKESGAIDASTLYSLRLGNKRIFSQRSPDVDTDTVVGILVDQSGSMGSGDHGSNKAHVARKATLALAETLHRVGIPFAVWGFDNDYSANVRATTEEAELYNRFEGSRTEVYKGFDENFNRCRTRFVNISGHGNNVDSEFVQWAARQLAHRKESRKILMVISDGMPQASGDCDIMAAHLKEVVQQTINAGIEVFGIGVMTDAVKDFYPDHVVVNEIGELAKAVFTMFKKYLLDIQTKGNGSIRKRTV
jgi:cobaltochelatase CobT